MERGINGHILVEETALASFEHMADRLAQRVASGKYFASLFLTMISIESVYLDESVNQTCRRLYDDWQKLYADHLVRFGFSEEESVPKAQAIFALIHGSMISSWIKRDPADLMMAKKRCAGSSVRDKKKEWYGRSLICWRLRKRSAVSLVRMIVFETTSRSMLFPWMSLT